MVDQTIPGGLALCVLTATERSTTGLAEQIRTNDSKSALAC